MELLPDCRAGNYFAVVSTYIHLNPARAGLIRAGKEPLTGCRWSSYRWYLRGAAGRPVWFVTERVLGNLGLAPEDRKGYEAYLEGRVLELALKRGRQELEQEWKAIRRGWYLGGEAFKERMLALLEAPLRRARSSSYSGQAKWAHSEAEAQRLLVRGLAALGLQESELAKAAKGAGEKQVLAWWLCQHTTARRRWVSERLGMGDESRVTQAIRSVKRGRQRAWEPLKARLAQAYQPQPGKAGI